MALRSKPRPISQPDILTNLIAEATVTAANTNHPTVDQGQGFGTITNPQVAIYVTVIKSSVGDEGYVWTLHQSDDNFAADDDTIGTHTIQSAAADDLIYVDNAPVVFNTDAITKRYYRLVSTVSGTLPSYTVAGGSYLGAK